MEEFTNIIDFKKFVGLPLSLDKDFDVSRLESYKSSLSLNTLPAFRHRFFSVCLGEELDMELNVGYYKRKPKVPFLMFKSPYQILSWQIQPGLKFGWHLLFTEDFMFKHPLLNDIVQEFAFLQLDKAIPFEIDETDLKPLTDIFQKIKDEYEAGLADRYELIASYVHMLLLHIRRLYEKYIESDNELKTIAKQSDSIVFNKFKDLIIRSNGEYFGDNRNVSFYAGQLAIHPNYLNAVIKRITGESALNLIHNQTIASAKTLLLQSELSIKEISFQLAFKEPTHFSAFFKKHTGISPAQFRQQIIVS